MKKIGLKSKKDVLVWARQTPLGLPDHWPVIQQRLARQNPSESRMPRKRIWAWVIPGLAALLILVSLLAGRVWPRDTHGTYTQATGTSGASGPTGTMTEPDPAHIAFSDWANAQYAKLEQAGIPEQYAPYAGSYIASDYSAYVILVTGEPQDFIASYRDLLDFSRIEVRQVKYSLKALQAAFTPLQKAFFESDELVKLGVSGMGVSEPENAIFLVVDRVTASLRQAVARIVPDTAMVVFEVDGRIVPFS